MLISEALVRISDVEAYSIVTIASLIDINLLRVLSLMYLVS